MLCDFFGLINLLYMVWEILVGGLGKEAMAGVMEVALNRPAQLNAPWAYIGVGQETFGSVRHRKGKQRKPVLIL